MVGVWPRLELLRIVLFFLMQLRCAHVAPRQKRHDAAQVLASPCIMTVEATERQGALCGAAVCGVWVLGHAHGVQYK